MGDACWWRHRAGSSIPAMDVVAKMGDQGRVNRLCDLDPDTVGVDAAQQRRTTAEHHRCQVDRQLVDVTRVEGSTRREGTTVPDPVGS